MYCQLSQDRQSNVRMAVKLRDEHFTAPPFATVRVNLAAQTSSQSVAIGINMLCALNYLTDEASATAEFIETFDQLFIALNSASGSSSHT